MPWIPEDAPYNLLTAVPASQCIEWVGGGFFDNAPHRESSTVYACRIDRNVTEPGSTGVCYKKGMQGQFLGMSEKHKDVAIVLIQGVTEGNGFASRSIRRACIDVEKPWKEERHQ
jgi:hypothetical protein